MQSMPILCDVVVVGAGLAGAAVARELVEAGLQVVVLESREFVGGGALEGAAEGWALLGLPDFYDVLVEQRGERWARDAWRLTQENLEHLSDRAADLAVATERVGSFRPVATSTAAEHVERSFHLLEDVGFDVSLDDATDLGLLVGLSTRGDLRFDQAALIAALLDHPDITVETGVEVESVEGGDEGVDVWAKRLYVRSGVAVLASGAHVVRLSEYLRPHVTTVPLRTVTCRAPEERVPPLILEEGRVLVGGMEERWQIAAWSTDEEVTPEQLIAQTGERFCPEARILAQSGTWIVQSVDTLPLVGSLPDMPGVFTLAALGPWGSSWAFAAAKKLTALIQRQQDAGLLDLQRLKEE